MEGVCLCESPAQGVNPQRC